MNYTNLVATLVAGPGTTFPQGLLQKIGAKTEWLAQGEAADVFAEGIGIDEWRKKLLVAIGDAPVDVIVQPVAGRRKKLLAADMESTIIEQELLDELAGEIGVRDKVAHITARAMNGEIDFAAALRARIGLFDGKPTSILEKAAELITYTPGAGTLVATMKENGAQAWLITGGFGYFARPVAKILGFDKSFANELVLKGDVITGEAGEPVLDRNRKKVLLEQACAELKLSLAETLSVGDGSNDIPMLTASNQGGGMGIAFQAKPKVRAEIPNQVNYGDLTVLLYAQGYRKEEFRSGA